MLKLSLIPKTSFLLYSLLTLTKAASDSTPPYTPCPLLGSFYPPPTLSPTSNAVGKLSASLQRSFDELIRTGGSEIYGPITPNTTSFSVVLFTGDQRVSDPVLFNYHYTSPRDYKESGKNVTSDSKFPIGDATMVFTVYAWLIQNGDAWETPITTFLPEFRHAESVLSPQWHEITIGSLAGHMSGLGRESSACTIGNRCDYNEFVNRFSKMGAVFLPDTTPVVSRAAFQLLSFAMERASSRHLKHRKDFSEILRDLVLEPLGMTNSGLLSENMTDIFASGNLNSSQVGEPGALSLVTSVNDIAKAGQAMLSSSLLAPAITRRWLHPFMDTSNIRNGVGRPWEVYRAGNADSAIIVDVLTMAGSLGQYSSYFGLISEFNAGFAIMAHDDAVADEKLDLNVYADIVSAAVEQILLVAAQETHVRFAGSYAGSNNDAAILDITNDGPGLVVQKLIVNGKNIRDEAALKLGIEPEGLDLRLYSTNVRNESTHQFVAVYQDTNALVDAGTPTCITWQEIGATVNEYLFRFNLGQDGKAEELVAGDPTQPLRRVATNPSKHGR